MADDNTQTDKQNCTFLFKKRKIRNNAARKRRGDGVDSGESRRTNISVNVRLIYFCGVRVIALRLIRLADIEVVHALLFTRQLVNIS